MSDWILMFLITRCPDFQMAFTYFVMCLLQWQSVLKTLRPWQNGRHFPDDSFKGIFLNENVWILMKISLKFVPKGPINNISALVQIMVWCRPGGKPLSEPVMVSLLTHICVTRPQWVKMWLISHGLLVIKIYCCIIYMIYWYDSYLKNHCTKNI